jgi:putative transposase
VFSRIPAGLENRHSFVGLLKNAPEEKERGMKKRFSEEQISQILREAETSGSNLDVCRRYGFSEQTFHHWRRKYQGLSVPEFQRLKRLESENAKLTRLVAEQALAIQGLQEFLTKQGVP